ncbi:MAG TPA: class I SAM-dependent methyltransferase, partial [Bryobacteraceae bacterium]|nr:class I SAM-dependent methyltransferase [Bryobacteraceae bacterium]
RAYRLRELDRVRVLEVDLAEVQAAKRARLRTVPENVRFAAIDFDRETLDRAFEGAGLEPDEPAVFIWEGVTQYLKPESVDAVLRTIAARPRGTQLLFTYICADAIAEQGYRPEPWHFGIRPSELRQFLGQRGLVLVEDRGAEEHMASCLKPLTRELDVSNIERLASAAVEICD